MNRLITRLGTVGLVLMPSAAVARAQQSLGTAFTYQGRLDEDGRPANATADLRFRLFDAESAGTLIGQDLVANVDVVDGLFTATVDFGAPAFSGDARWLEIAVRSPAGAGTFATLTPRQPLTAAPYARFGAAAPWAGLTGVPAGFADGIDHGSGDGHSLDAADGSPTNALFVDNDGDVGVGTAAPLAKLHVNSGDLYVGLPTNGWFFHTRFPFNGDFMHLTDTVNGVPQFQRGLVLTKPGDVGIGTASPLAKLHVNSGDLYVGLPTNGWFFHTRASFNGDFMHITDTLNGVPQFQHGLVLTKPGNVGIGTVSPTAKLDVNGTTRTKVLEITGADLAEKFPASEPLEPGMVVAIDPLNPGKLCLARGAYNRCVAGIVSGANDFSAGAVLGNLPGSEHAPPVALSGRVYVHCDATGAAIRPGDLLTTSDTPGHAMKSLDHGRAQGAILGKAMTGLNSGSGLVLVLVSLQ